MLTVFRDLLVNLAATVVGDISSPTGMLGYMIGIGAVVLWIIGWHRNRASRGRRGVDSWYFIVPSLAVAFVAVGFATYGIGLRSIKATVSPEPIAAPAAVAPLKLAKNYFPAEKTELGNLLSDVLTHLNSEGAQARQIGWSLGSRPQGVQSKEQLKELQDRVEQARLRIVNLSRSLFQDGILGNNPKFVLELQQVLGSNGADNLPIGPFQRALNTYHRDLDVTLAQYDKMPQDTRDFITDELFKRDAQAAADTSSAFQGWITECSARIDGMREVLR